MAQTEAQEEFQAFVAKNSRSDDDHLHPEDRLEQGREAAQAASYEELDEEERYRNGQIDAAMRMPTFSGGGSNGSGGVSLSRLPPTSFDSGRATGVKGVIADARSYELARKSTWKGRMRQARRSVFGFEAAVIQPSRKSESDEDDEDGDRSDDDRSSSHDEESFISQWRESRLQELERDARSGSSIRTRRTSPSVRIYGRMDTVDALGYLDAIEKVGRETVVVVFVYDEDCQVSSAVEAALAPLVGANPTVRFVKVHYDDIEFDNAAVPTILAYRNQGDLFANLTGLIEMLPGDDDINGADEDAFSTATLRKLLQSHNIL